MLIRFALSLASALCVAAAMPGPGYVALAFVGLTLWAAANERPSSARVAFFADYAWGVVFFGLTVFWLSRITWIAFLPVVFLAPLFIAFAGAVYRRLRRRLPAAIALPLAWLASEVLRSSYPFLFPWGLTGYCAAGWLDLAGLASLGGPWLLTLFFGFVNGALVDVAFSKGRRRILWLLTAIVAVAAAPILGNRLRKGHGPVSQGPLIACVQPNIPQSMKEDSGVSWQEVVRKILTGTKAAGKTGADLVILPETLFPPELVRNANPGGIFRDGRKISEVMGDEREMLQVLRKYLGPKTWLLTGVKLYDRLDPASDRLQLFNSAILYNPADVEVARYDKRYLVPGAEELILIPEGWLADQFRQALDPYTQGMVPEMIPGRGAAVFDIPAGTTDLTPRAGIAICYDNAFANLFRDAALTGANFHIVLSNEGWFPESSEMDAMLAFSSFRAIETRRSIVRCTNTGISCLVDPDGTVSEILQRDGRRSEIEGVLTVRPKLCADQTLYLVTGDLPAFVLAGLALVLSLLLRRPRELSVAALNSP